MYDERLEEKGMPLHKQESKTPLHRIPSQRLHYNECFVSHNPCIYQGEILCNDCEIHKHCDMEAGRMRRYRSFIDGALSDSLIGKKRFVKKNKSQNTKNTKQWISLRQVEDLA